MMTDKTYAPKEETADGEVGLSVFLQDSVPDTTTSRKGKKLVKSIQKLH